MTSLLNVSLDVTAVPANPAGAGRYVVDLVGALAARADLDLVLVARRDDGPRWARLAPQAQVRAIAPVGRAHRLLWEQVVLPRVLDQQPPSCHHSPHYTMPERSSIPTAVTIHDLTFFDNPEWHERAKVPVFRRAIRVAARHADALVCVSEATARRLRSVCDPVGEVRVIPHGVDHDRFHARATDADDDVLSRLEVAEPYVLFLGTLEPRKDVPTLVSAFDRIASDHVGLSLVLAGGRGWGADAVNAAVRASPFTPRIRTLGYVPDEAVAPLLRRAAAVAYPSLAEGFGLPALEALACGAPLVTSAGTAMADLAGDAALLFPAGDASALADALADALAPTPAAAQRRIAGLTRAREHTWDRTAAAHVELYRTIAAR